MREHCEGCDEQRETARYAVSWESGGVERVRYCPDCAGMIAGGWLPEAVGIVCVEVPPARG